MLSVFLTFPFCEDPQCEIHSLQSLRVAIQLNIKKKIN